MTAAALLADVVVSVVSTRLDLLRDHWTRAGEDAERPLGALDSAGKPLELLGGALCGLDGAAEPTYRDTWMPAGLAAEGDTFLVTSPWAVSRWDGALKCVDEDVFPVRELNAVHWVSRTPSGWLLTSSGVDALLELDDDGHCSWQWWATEHGFDVDPLGRRRHIDRRTDHRGIDYGTLAQTTHVNAAAWAEHDVVLASLFHQGTVIAVDRATGTARTVLSGLRHPHAVRSLPDGRASVADTGTGRVLVFDPSGEREPECVVRCESDWLQDACLDPANARWLLVDGRHSRLIGVECDARLRARGKPQSWSMDANWRPYAVLPWAGGVW